MVKIRVEDFDGNFTLEHSVNGSVYRRKCAAAYLFIKNILSKPSLWGMIHDVFLLMLSTKRAGSNYTEQG